MLSPTVNEAQLQAFLRYVAKTRGESDRNDSIDGRYSMPRVLLSKEIRGEKLHLGYLLNSLANQCTREHKEVVALALTLLKSRKNEDTIKLLISTNSNKLKSTIDHLETVWQMVGNCPIFNIGKRVARPGTSIARRMQS